MTAPTVNGDRLRLVDALHEAWAAEDQRVAQFGLVLIEDGIRPSYGGWAVPVASGVPTGSAYELARTLDRLQELAEERAGFSISLYLDPFAKLNGTR